MTVGELVAYLKLDKNKWDTALAGAKNDLQDIRGGVTKALGFLGQIHAPIIASVGAATSEIGRAHV